MRVYPLDHGWCIPAWKEYTSRKKSVIFTHSSDSLWYFICQWAHGQLLGTTHNDSWRSHDNSPSACNHFPMSCSFVHLSATDQHTSSEWTVLWRYITSTRWVNKWWLDGGNYEHNDRWHSCSIYSLISNWSAYVPPVNKHFFWRFIISAVDE